MSGIPENNEQAVEYTQYHLTLFQCASEDGISRSSVYEVQVELERTLNTPPESTAIDIWIESPGGDAHAAYKMIVDLRSRCSRLRAIIPDYAKSAATLLTLGVDEIFMSPAAELGPLDVQIGHPDRETERISGLDVASSYDFLGQLAITMILSGGGLTVRYTKLPRMEVLHEASQFVAKFLEPSIARLDPHIVSKAKRQLEVAERYAMKMLAMRNVSPEYELDTSRARKLIKQLINDYPVHEFVIVPQEARELNLPVRDISEHPNWSDMREIYQFCEQNLVSDIRVFTESTLQQFASVLRGEDEDDTEESNINVEEPSLGDSKITPNTDEEEGNGRQDESQEQSEA